MIGILHFIGNIISGGLLGTILVIVYLVAKKDELTTLERETCREIINFNLSFIIYTSIGGVLMWVLIGFLIVPIVVITWFILLIIGFSRHLKGESYDYPFVIRFLS